jgi:hypothetical protein
MTFSEMRSSYEVMKEQNREIIIGSTNVWNPSTFVDSLKKLDKIIQTDRFEITEDVNKSTRNSIMPRQSATSSTNSRNSVLQPTDEDVSRKSTRSFLGKGNSRESLVPEDASLPQLKTKSTKRGLRNTFTVKRK